MLLQAFALITIAVRSVFAFSQCYFPDGSIPNDYVWESCTGSQYSSCCVPSEGDICQPNGLCYYPLNDALYRGTCTDRTWNDPSCNADICVTGYETTWMWATECETSGSSSWACGNITDGGHEQASCPASAQTQSISFQTTSTTSSAGRYTPPPSIDTSLYSLITNTHTTIITADVQTTTLTSTFESTSTSTISRATGSVSGSGSTGVGASNTNTPSSGATTNRVSLSPGVIAAIVIGPTLAAALVLAAFFFIRRKSKRDRAVRLNSLTSPPPNGRMRTDQVNPYEMGNQRTSNQHRTRHEYSAISDPSAHEVDGFPQEKSWNRPGVSEIGGEMRSPVSPAPRYSEAATRAELDGASSMRGQLSR